MNKCGHATEKMQALDIAMQYNFMLYFVHYTEHLDQIETVSNIGDVMQMSSLEMMKLSPEIDILHSMKTETADISPDDYIENGLFTRIHTQFAWGSRYCPPFTHSTDSSTCIASTLNNNGA